VVDIGFKETQRGNKLLRTVGVDCTIATARGVPGMVRFLSVPSSLETEKVGLVWGLVYNPKMKEGEGDVAAVLL
jgi:hypothetical protein